MQNEKLKDNQFLTNAEICNLRLAPIVSLRISPKFIQYLDENHILFVSGCNLVTYDLQTKKQKFLLRKYNQLVINVLSVGTISSLGKKSKENIHNEKEHKEPLIILGEHDDKKDLFHITVIKPSVPNQQYHLVSSLNKWKIIYATILNNSPYCVSISTSESNSKKSPIHSRISFMKYTAEKFISEETIPEELTYICYNPQNTLELVVCGKGYLRFWNIFINEGSLKEHQQRFLRGKQEKEHTFIKAQFFSKKKLIVGTTANIFYIIDSFQVLHELNVFYSYENIFDLNVQNYNVEDDQDDIGELKGFIDTINKSELDSKLKTLSVLTSQSKTNAENFNANDTRNNNIIEENENKEDYSDSVFKRLYKGKEKVSLDYKVNKQNKIKYFELLNDNLLFVIYHNDGIILLYKIEWNKKSEDNNDNSSNNDNENDNRKWNINDCKIIRIAKNIKAINNYSLFKSRNDTSSIILMVDIFEKKDNKGAISTSLYKMRRNGEELGFEYKMFNGFFEETPVKYYEMNEKKGNIYFINNDNIFSCFDINKNEYIIHTPLDQIANEITSCPLNNLLAVAFPNKVTIFAQIKTKLHPFCDLDVNNSICKWATKGDFIAVGGENRKESTKKSYCLYFVETVGFSTLNVFENLAHRILQLKFFDNDKYIFLLLENSFVVGFYIDTSACSMLLHQMNDERGQDIYNTHFKLMFTHNPKGSQFNEFEYDEQYDLLVALQSDKPLMSVVSNAQKTNQPTINHEIPCTLTTIRIIKELRILIGGDQDGSVKIFNWPFIGYENEYSQIKLSDNLKSMINLHQFSIVKEICTKNNNTFITLSNDGCLILSHLQIETNNEYRHFSYFTKSQLPQFETMLPPIAMYEMKIEDITRKDKNVEILDKALVRMVQTMDADIEEIKNVFKTELENMENNLKQNADDEETKYKGIEKEIEDLKLTMNEDLNRRQEELRKDKEILTKKYEEKINLYESEINRLKQELNDIKESIEQKYENEITNQREFFESLNKDYNEKFTVLKSETDKALLRLVHISSEYDDATDVIVKDYEMLVSNLDEKIKETKRVNESIVKKKEDKLREEKKMEDSHKDKLDQKVKESDSIIEKNIEIKQNIINDTQRTITFQEQLLETEKNLIKIDKKLEDLVIKNKHLEQIRFVLEHRMTSLEKEKAPLEGQCSFLENQKNKLTEEFNKIILQINMQNQELENKQSQLRASLIQNYEIHDQKNYVESKLVQLKNEIEQFLLSYKDKEEAESFSENKATKVALNFKRFYDKYFGTAIEEELSNYQLYAQKLQEQTDKDGIANNIDLIMRNKGEEKLICEKDKLDELKEVKEKGFKRMQNENTILIAECNRLRKNLHEIYMHVVDIEQRFENLTKINPKLSKGEIVNQIKDFIKATHEKIKENYSKGKNSNQNKNKVRLTSSFLNASNEDLFKDDNQKKSQHLSDLINNPNMQHEENKNEKSDYEGIIRLPEIKNKNMSFLSHKQDIFEQDSSSKSINQLPKIEG